MPNTVMVLQILMTLILVVVGVIGTFFTLVVCNVVLENIKRCIHYKRATVVPIAMATETTEQPTAACLEVSLSPTLVVV
jgi:hypothetical protein